MKIANVEAIAASFPLPEDQQVEMSIGKTVKRDVVVVKVTTDDGIVGYGEAHHGRSPTAVAEFVNTTLKGLVVGRDAFDTVGIWKWVERKQIGSHGVGAAACFGLSGLDIALWDAKGKALGAPVYQLLGGTRKPVPAYAGGIALGYQAPDALVAELTPMVEAGYGAVKLRLGQSFAADAGRAEAVRKAFDEVAILTDANTGYRLADVRRIMPVLEACRAEWLEEPFPSYDFASYREARSYGNVPLACGENHYTRHEFLRLLEDGVVRVFQPDVSKTGGITEIMRIAALASPHSISINPHTSTSILNMAASVHVLCAIENGGYYEGEGSKQNPFRDDLGDKRLTVDANGCVTPFDGPGLGIAVDEDVLRRHPGIPGPSYV